MDEISIEVTITILIYLHAALGSVALIAGALALYVTKGGELHRKSGKVFFYSMMVSAILSLLVSTMPGHENPFLFSIGIFSSYFLITGYRSLSFKKKNFELAADRILSFGIIITGIAMISYPLFLDGDPNFVLLIFGSLSILFGIRDLVLFLNKEKLRKQWLRIHLGKMTGGYIAAITAFFVVNEILPGLWSWFTPTIFGGVYIAYWVRMVEKK